MEKEENNRPNKERLEIIRKNYQTKRLFCYICQEYTFNNKLYKNSDDIDNEIMVKFYCSESHQDHCYSLFDYLFNCCNEEFFEDFQSYRDGQKMKLTDEELNNIKNNLKIANENINKSSLMLKDKIIKSIPDKNSLTEIQKKLYEKFEKCFENNLFQNKLLFYFIQMNINTYEQAFSKYHSQAIICSLRNFTDFINNKAEDEIISLKDDIIKNLLNGIKYFKNNFIIKIYEPEIDIYKIKNTSNILMENDQITCLKYLDKYKVLLFGSLLGNIYCYNIDTKQIFLKIQAHKEEEENTGNWGILYINEITGNRLISCCEDSTMKLWEIIEKNIGDKNKTKIDIKFLRVIRGHKDMVRKIIELKRGENENDKNLKIVTCSFDCCLGLWQEKSKNNFELIKIMKSHNNWINEIYEIYDGRLFALGGEQDPSLKIWNLLDYSYESVKEEIFSVNHDCIIEINKDFYIFGGAHTYIYLFRLSGKMMIRVIYIDNMYINSLFLLPDGNLFTDSGKNLIKYVDLGNYKVKDGLKTDSKGKINRCMIKLDNRSFVTCDENRIKIWEIK